MQGSLFKSRLKSPLKQRLKSLRQESLRVTLLCAVLSITACQSPRGEVAQVTTGPEVDETIAPTNRDDASSGAIKEASPVPAVVRLPVSLHLPVAPLSANVENSLRAQNSPSEKHFVIPVTRSGQLAPQALDEYLMNIIAELRQWTYVEQVQVHGHTDSEGSQLSNMLLSIRRANRVAERFEALGVEAGLLLIEAHGETQAIADNTTLDGRIANRRIEVVIMGDAGSAAEPAQSVANEGQPYDALVAKLRSTGARP